MQRTQQSSRRLLGRNNIIKAYKLKIRNERIKIKKRTRELKKAEDDLKNPIEKTAVSLQTSFRCSSSDNPVDTWLSAVESSHNTSLCIDGGGNHKDFCIVYEHNDLTAASHRVRAERRLKPNQLLPHSVTYAATKRGSDPKSLIKAATGLTADNSTHRLCIMALQYITTDINLAAKHTGHYEDRPRRFNTKFLKATVCKAVPAARRSAAQSNKTNVKSTGDASQEQASNYLQTLLDIQNECPTQTLTCPQSTESLNFLKGGARRLLGAGGRRRRRSLTREEKGWRSRFKAEEKKLRGVRNQIEDTLRQREMQRQVSRSSVRREALARTVSPPMKLECAVRKVQIKEIKGADFYRPLGRYGKMVKYESKAIQLDDGQSFGLLMTTQVDDDDDEHKRCLTAAKATCSELKSNTNRGRVKLAECAPTTWNKTKENLLWEVGGIREADGSMQIRLQYQRANMRRTAGCCSPSHLCKEGTKGSDCLSSNGKPSDGKDLILAPCDKKNINTLWKYNSTSRQLMSAQDESFCLHREIVRAKRGRTAKGRRRRMAIPVIKWQKCAHIEQSYQSRRSSWGPEKTKEVGRAIKAWDGLLGRIALMTV